MQSGEKIVDYHSVGITLPQAPIVEHFVCAGLGEDLYKANAEAVYGRYIRCMKVIWKGQAHSSYVTG